MAVWLGKMERSPPGRSRQPQPHHHHHHHRLLLLLFFFFLLTTVQFAVVAQAGQSSQEQRGPAAAAPPPPAAAAVRSVRPGHVLFPCFALDWVERTMQRSPVPLLRAARQGDVLHAAVTLTPPTPTPTHKTMHHARNGDAPLKCLDLTNSHSAEKDSDLRQQAPGFRSDEQQALDDAIREVVEEDSQAMLLLRMLNGVRARLVAEHREGFASMPLLGRRPVRHAAAPVTLVLINVNAGVAAAADAPNSCVVAAPSVVGTPAAADPASGTVPTTRRRRARAAVNLTSQLAQHPTERMPNFLADALRENEAGNGALLLCIASSEAPGPQTLRITTVLKPTAALPPEVEVVAAALSIADVDGFVGSVVEAESIATLEGQLAHMLRAARSPVARAPSSSQNGPVAPLAAVAPARLIDCLNAVRPRFVRRIAHRSYCILTGPASPVRDELKRMCRVDTTSESPSSGNVACVRDAAALEQECAAGTPQARWLHRDLRVPCILWEDAVAAILDNMLVQAVTHSSPPIGSLAFGANLTLVGGATNHFPSRIMLGPVVLEAFVWHSIELRNSSTYCSDPEVLMPSLCPEGRRRYAMMHLVHFRVPEEPSVAASWATAARCSGGGSSDGGLGLSTAASRQFVRSLQGSADSATFADAVLPPEDAALALQTFCNDNEQDGDWWRHVRLDAFNLSLSGRLRQALVFLDAEVEVDGVPVMEFPRYIPAHPHNISVVLFQRGPEWLLRNAPPPDISLFAQPPGLVKQRAPLQRIWQRTEGCRGNAVRMMRFNTAMHVLEQAGPACSSSSGSSNCRNPRVTLLISASAPASPFHRQFIWPVVLWPEARLRVVARVMVPAYGHRLAVRVSGLPLVSPVLRVVGTGRFPSHATQLAWHVDPAAAATAAAAAAGFAATTSVVATHPRPCSPLSPANPAGGAGVNDQKQGSPPPPHPETTTGGKPGEYYQPGEEPGGPTSQQTVRCVAAEVRLKDINYLRHELSVKLQLAAAPVDTTTATPPDETATSLGDVVVQLWLRSDNFATDEWILLEPQQVPPGRAATSFSSPPPGEPDDSETPAHKVPNQADAAPIILRGEKGKKKEEEDGDDAARAGTAPPRQQQRRRQRRPVYLVADVPTTYSTDTQCSLAQGERNGTAGSGVADASDASGEHNRPCLRVKAITVLLRENPEVHPTSPLNNESVIGLRMYILDGDASQLRNDKWFRETERSFDESLTTFHVRKGREWSAEDHEEDACGDGFQSFRVQPHQHDTARRMLRLFLMVIGAFSGTVLFFFNPVTYTLTQLANESARHSVPLDAPTVGMLQKRFRLLTTALPGQPMLYHRHHLIAAVWNITVTLPTCSSVGARAILCCMEFYQFIVWSVMQHGVVTLALTCFIAHDEFAMWTRCVLRHVVADVHCTPLSPEQLWSPMIVGVASLLLADLTIVRPFENMSLRVHPEVAVAQRLALAETVSMRLGMTTLVISSVSLAGVALLWWGDLDDPGGSPLARMQHLEQVSLAAHIAYLAIVLPVLEVLVWCFPMVSRSAALLVVAIDAPSSQRGEPLFLPPPQQHQSPLLPSSLLPSLFIGGRGLRGK